MLPRATPFYQYDNKSILALVFSPVRNGQFVAPFGTTGSQYFATIGGGHTFAETVFVATFAVGGLESAFHNLFVLDVVNGCYRSFFRGAKVMRLLEEAIANLNFAHPAFSLTSLV